VPKETEKEVYLHVKAMDPVGRRVDPGQRYLPEDRSTSIRHRRSVPCGGAYGWRFARPSVDADPYTFPTICSWYAGVLSNRPPKSSGEEPVRIATTTGQVAK